MRGTCLAALVVLVACVGGTAAAHPVLTFTEHVETRPYKDSSVKSATEEGTIRVTLGRNYVSTDRKGSRSILDFEKRRIYKVSLSEKTFSDSSLYAVLGFHAMELQNRLQLNAVLKAAQVENPSNTPALAEHLFSLRAAGQNTAIDSSHSGDTTAYQWQGRELLSISDKSRPVPSKGYQAQYWRWLRYTAGGHPAIHSALSVREGVPETLKVLRPDVGADTLLTLKLAGIANEADTPYSLAGFKRAPPDREPWLTLLKLDAAAANDTERDAAILRERDAATAEGRFLDAALAHFAHQLSTGGADTVWLSQVRDRLTADSDARSLITSLGAANAEQAKRGAETLRSLRSRATSPHAYVLDVFAANHLNGLRQAAEAEKLFLSALSANPRLTGAWFDLGKLYYATFRTPEAWACWDGGRSLRPDHPFARDITAMERRMVADHPEFFQE